MSSEKKFITELPLKKLTLEEHYGITSANFYLSSLAPRAFKRAARTLKKQKRTELANLFLNHAADETGHHYWAWDDLRAMEKPLLPMTNATKNLLDWVESIVESDSPYRLLALSTVAERIAPTLDVKSILPDENTPCSYITKHVIADSHHEDEIDRMLDLLSNEEKKETESLIPEAKHLYYDHLLTGAKSGSCSAIECYLTRRGNGQYMLTTKKAIRATVEGTGKDDMYIDAGDPLGVNNLCVGGVKWAYGSLNRFESDKISLYFVPVSVLSTF